MIHFLTSIRQHSYWVKQKMATYGSLNLGLSQHQILSNLEDDLQAWSSWHIKHLQEKIKVIFLEELNPERAIFQCGTILIGYSHEDRKTIRRWQWEMINLTFLLIPWINKAVVLLILGGGEINLNNGIRGLLVFSLFVFVVIKWRKACDLCHSRHSTEKAGGVCSCKGFGMKKKERKILS